MTTTKNEVKTPAGGWTWILRNVELQAARSSRGKWDGVYVAACPGCGRDCAWNAWDGNPLCDCHTDG